MNFPMPVTGKAWQRQIREQQAALPDPLLAEKQVLAASLKNATVREVDYQTAKEFIVRYEWLKSMVRPTSASGCTSGSIWRVLSVSVARRARRVPPQFAAQNMPTWSRLFAVGRVRLGQTHRA
jgi:hypothetical protein